MRRTRSQLKVAAALMRDPDGRHYGYQLGVESSIRSGVLYPILRRFEEAGLLAGEWESLPRPGRPPRRYYRLTHEGRLELTDLLSAGIQT